MGRHRTLGRCCPGASRRRLALALWSRRSDGDRGQPQLAELGLALRQVGPVFVHCLAAMECSPLVCIGWLVQQHRVDPQLALDYIQMSHPGNPLPGQLSLLQELQLV